MDKGYHVGSLDSIPAELTWQDSVGLTTQELGKLAGELLDVFVNSKLVARGEAVVVNEKFGVRLVDIISPAERVEKIV